MIYNLKEKLSILNPTILKITNQSHLHAKHFENNTGNSHFSICIVSNEFKNLTKVKRHKIILDILKNELKTNIHALAIKTFTPDEYEAKNS